MKISRQAYADMFGPTVGDKVRLADTELWIEVEKDFTTYGEEVKFGGGKVIRDGMGQGQLCAADVVDTLITNALILDHWGIVKADVGLKDGRIAAIGKAGNPDIQPGVTIGIRGDALQHVRYMHRVEEVADLHGFLLPLGEGTTVAAQVREGQHLPAGEGLQLVQVEAAHGSDGHPTECGHQSGGYHGGLFALHHRDRRIHRPGLQQVLTEEALHHVQLGGIAAGVLKVDERH